MLRNVPGLLAFYLTCSACLPASGIKGKILDPSGAPVPGAQIAAVNRVGVVAQTTAAANGSFQLDAPDTANTRDTRLVVTAPGFATRTLALDQAASVQLEIAPRVDSVQVIGSTIQRVNSAPILAPIQNYTINEGSRLVITNQATDYDVP